MGCDALFFCNACKKRQSRKNRVIGEQQGARNVQSVNTDNTVNPACSWYKSRKHPKSNPGIRPGIIMDAFRGEGHRRIDEWVSNSPTFVNVTATLCDMPGLAGLEAVIQRSPKMCAHWPAANNAQLAEVHCSTSCPNIKKVSMTRTCGSLYGVPGVKLLRKIKIPPPLAAILPLKNTEAYLTFKHRTFHLQMDKPNRTYITATHTREDGRRSEVLPV